MSNIVANILARGALALGYDAAESRPARRDLGWGRAQPRDEDSLVADSTREKLRLRASDLRRNTILAGVCDRIPTFALGPTGLMPQARTSSKSWNRESEQWWAEYGKVCDYRQRISMRGFQCMAASLRPTHGGLYLELLANGQVRPIECERIRQPQDPDKAKGYVDGVKVDKVTGIILGYLVHERDENGGFTNEHKETFVPRENMIPFVTPPWRPDQIREIPDLAPVCAAFQDLTEANAFALQSFKVQNTFMGFLKKVAGIPMRMNPANTQAPGTRQTFKVDGGTILEGSTQEELQMLAAPTPANNHIPYIQMQIGFAAAGINFPYEFFTLDFSKCDFSRMKGVWTLINKTCADWRAWEAEPMQRWWNWRIAKAIKEGDLPPAPTVKRNGFEVSEWHKVEWQGPQEIQMDRQGDNQADMIEWQMGLGPLSKPAKRRGGDLEDLLREKAENLTTSYEIEDEFKLPRGTLIKTQIPGQTEPGQSAAPQKADAMEENP